MEGQTKNLEKCDFSKGMEFGYRKAKQDIALHILTIANAPTDNSIAFQDSFKLSAIKSYAQMLVNGK